jgi:hypothetical protein
MDRFRQRYPKVRPSSFMLARMKACFYAGAESAIREIEPENSQAAYVLREIYDFNNKLRG